MKQLLFSFRGRVSRQPYWLATLAIMAAGGTVQSVLGPFGPDRPMTAVPAAVSIVFFVLAAWIGLAVQVKRWHDRDKSGWWALINLVPVLGPLWVLIECGFLKGAEGANRFGEDPLAVDGRT